MSKTAFFDNIKNAWGNILLAIVLLLEVITIVFLKSSESYFSIYLIIGLFGVYSTIRNKITKKERWLVFLSLFYSFSVTFSNLNMSILHLDSSLFTVSDNLEKYSRFGVLANGCTLFIVFIGWFLISLNALHALEQLIVSRISSISKNSFSQKLTSNRVFLVSLGIIFLLYVIHFILFSAPGTVSEDSFNQITQIFTNQYSNHHPFYYTILLRLFIRFGVGVFSNINYGIAMYTLLQISIVSISMALCIKVLFEMVPSLRNVFLVIIWFLLPYNFVMASSLTKDVLFSAVMTLMMTSLIKIMFDSTVVSFGYFVLLVISSIATGILRNNGTIIVIALTVAFLLASIKNTSNRKILFSLIIATVVCIVLKYPILRALNVPPTEFSEGLSIPLQQVSRVVVDGCELSEEEYSFINKVLEIEEIKRRYDKGISDPIKGRVNNNFMSNNKLMCLKIWFRLGIRYPREYIKAYFDQTKGFWNGGYNYSTVGEYIAEADFNPGIKKISVFRFKSFAYLLTNLFRFVPVFDLLISIGVHIWILMFVFARNISNNMKKSSLILLPYVLLVITLWLTTPVYTQFRYAYPIIMGFPIIISSIYYEKSDR